MTTVSQTIRNMDRGVFRKFRGKCAELDIPTGDAATEAFRLWLEKKGVKL